MERIVVIGAGHAAAQLCESLRRGGHEGAITVIGEEPWHPYQRPPLSKAYLSGELARERLFVKPPAFYDEHRIDLRLGTRAEAIDREAREVVLGDGGRVGYDALVLLTGARVRRLDCPGAGLGGVMPIRGIDDADALATALEGGARRAVVVGGGYVGLEAAAVLRKRGLAVTVVHRSPRLLTRTASEATAHALQARHEAEGVALRLTSVVRAVHGQRRVEAVEIAPRDGGEAETITTDLVIEGIGVVPDTALAEAAGLEIGDGIELDTACRTSDPTIWAAGDVASLDHPDLGRVRLESVQNALDGAKAVAASILGSDAPYAPVPWFWSDQYDVKLQSAGLPNSADRAVWREGAKPGQGSCWLWRGERLVCVEALSDPRAYMTGKRWLEQGVSPDPARIADAGVPLKEAA